MNHNFFAKLNSEIVAPLKKQGAPVSMGNETLLITANHQGHDGSFNSRADE